MRFVSIPLKCYLSAVDLSPSCEQCRGMAYTGPETEILRAFGERVRRAREARGWSQEYLAEKAGMDRTYVGGIERGERNPALLNINRLALALGENFAGFLPYRTGRRRKH